MMLLIPHDQGTAYAQILGIDPVIPALDILHRDIVLAGDAPQTVTGLDGIGLGAGSTGGLALRRSLPLGRRGA